MKMQRIASLTALLSLTIMLLTSGVLFIVPHGRVAYWADWHLGGLSKDAWTAMHINAGILFLIAVVVHTLYNWKNITLYLQTKSRQWKICTGDFNIALVLTLLFVGGTQIGIPPFSTIITLNNEIKDAAGRTYGEPPYGHAELSGLRTFARHMDIDLADAMQGLEAAGYQVASDTDTLQTIAAANGVTPQQLYLAMRRPPGAAAIVPTMPARPAPGVGKLSLDALCAQYGLAVEPIVQALAEKGIRLQPGMTIKQIAEHNDLSPIDIYGRIRETGRDAAR